MAGLLVVLRPARLSHLTESQPLPAPGDDANVMGADGRAERSRKRWGHAGGVKVENSQGAETRLLGSRPNPRPAAGGTAEAV